MSGLVAPPEVNPAPFHGFLQFPLPPFANMAFSVAFDWDFSIWRQSNSSKINSIMTQGLRGVVEAWFCGEIVLINGWYPFGREARISIIKSPSSIFSPMPFNCSYIKLRVSM